MKSHRLQLPTLKVAFATATIAFVISLVGPSLGLAQDAENAQPKVSIGSAALCDWARGFSEAMREGLTIVTAPGHERFVVENSGTACFTRGERAGQVVINFSPHAGCLSSSCTKRYEQTLTAEVVEFHGMPTIALTSRFVLGRANGGQICTADCGGGGRASAKLEGLEGVYQVMLGGVKIGKVDTAALGKGYDRANCLQNAGRRRGRSAPRRVH